MRPVQHILSDPLTEDLAIQVPGEGWWLTRGSWNRIDIPEMTYQRLRGIATLAGAQTMQVIDHRAPILSTDLPGEIRLQAVVAPAVPGGTMAVTFRRGDDRVDSLSGVPKLYNTMRWNKWGERMKRRHDEHAALLDRYDAGDFEGFLQLLAETRQTGLFCGPTGAGKTRLSKLLGSLIPLSERIITIEDARELVVRQPNNIRHFYAASGIGVSQAQLIKATLRERPDRVMLAEMRDPEAADSFVADAMAGHPGSFSTIHGRTCGEAARRLFNLVKASETGQNMEDETVASMLGNAIDFIIPVENNSGARAIGEIWLAADAARRGEMFADLLKER